MPPWEKYAAPVEAPQGGPWAKYSAPQASEPSPEPQAPAPGPPPSALGRFAMGAGDLIQGGAQLAVNALPAGLVEAVNSATQAVNDAPVIGPITRALGMVPGTREGINQQTQQREADYQAARQTGGDTGIDWMRMAGNAAGALPVAAALPVGATIPGSIAAGMVGGAATGALEPVSQGEFWGGKQNQLMTNGMIGAATGPLGLLAGRAIAPRISQNVRTLEAAGVEMTPGQIIGGATRRIEDGLASIPLLGDQVRSAQRRSLESFNRGAANQALEPIGEAIPAATTAGREMVQETGDRISQAYTRAYSTAQPFRPDQQFAADIQQIGQQFLTPNSRNTFAAALQNDVISRIQAAGGQIDADTFQAIKTELGNRARQFAASQEPHNQEVADAFGSTLRAMHGLMARTNPQTAPLLRQADEAFARNVRVEGAAGRGAATNGVFTPEQFSGSVRSGDRSVRHNQFARGNALMQDLSDAGRDVLPNKLPDSGTGFRVMLGSLGVGGAAGMIDPTLATAAGLAFGAYTPPVQRLLRGALLARRPGAVNELGEAIAGSGGLAAGVIGGEMSRPAVTRNRLLND